MTTVRPTVCRICESQCGLLAEVHDDRVIGLRPDLEHPVSRGYACRKGTRFHTVHHGAGRLTAPRVDGATATWDAANAAIGARLAAVRARYGPEAVGLYSGNAAGHALGTVLGLTALQEGLGTTKHYSCLTLDNSGMFVVLEACLGSPLHTFMADYAGSDCIVLVGTDPLESQPSQAQSHPDGVRQLRRNARHLVVVDPRRSATARTASAHLAIRPGTDTHLLAWLLREALDAGRRDPWLAPADLEAIRAGLVVADPSHTGLPRSTLEGLRDRLLAAERPLVWSGLGVLLGPHGTVGYWLTLVLQAVLGGLDRPGGWVHHGGAVDLTRLGRWLGLTAREPTVRSRIGGYRGILGTVAAATLADDILTPGDRQLRALVVVGGNPAVSLPHTRRALQALRSLELLVCVDLGVNETGALAHAVLPARTWLARDEVAVHTAGQRWGAHLERVGAVVAPVGEAREDFQILTDLARAAGCPPFGSRLVDRAVSWLRPAGVARLAVLVAGRVPWSGLTSPGASAPPSSLRDRVRPRLADPELLGALPAALAAPTPGPVLVSSVRRATAMNTWLGAVGPTATAHPDRVRDGQLHLRDADDQPLTIPATPDASLHPEVIVVPFGRAGANVNHLVHTRQLDPITGQPVSNGLAVVVDDGG